MPNARGTTATCARILCRRLRPRASRNNQNLLRAHTVKEGRQRAGRAVRVRFGAPSLGPSSSIVTITSRCLATRASSAQRLAANGNHSRVTPAANRPILRLDGHDEIERPLHPVGRRRLARAIPGGGG